MPLRIDPDMAMLFTGFVNERHRVWEQRQQGLPAPWTDDPVLAARKFTNVFRWLDPGSQFVVNDLLEDDPNDTDFLLRCFLYRHTGRVEAWQFLDLMSGYPTTESLDAVLAAWKSYRGTGVTKKKPPRREGQVGRGNGNQATKFERPIFTGAYLVFPQSTVAGTDKLESIVALAQRLVDNGSFTRFVEADTQRQRFDALKSNKGVADFMSMQTLTDFGYRTEFREDDFVVCGPGATRGAAHLSPSAKAEDVARWAHEQFADGSGPVVQHPDIDALRFPPSLMDVQNCLCEFSKYVRYLDKPHPKPYQPAHPGQQPDFTVPRLW